MLQVTAGVVIVLLALLAWGGQVLSWLAPATAQRLSLTEARADVEPAFWADLRGEAVWDSFTLWTLVVAGAFLAVDASVWAYFGLVGGAIYLYFAGRGILTRRVMERLGLRIGAPSDVKAAYLMLAVWGVTGLGTMAAAVVALV